MTSKREELARIIDPPAFNFRAALAAGDIGNDRGSRKQLALEKTDAILDALREPSEDMWMLMPDHEDWYYWQGVIDHIKQEAAPDACP